MQFVVGAAVKLSGPLIFLVFGDGPSDDCVIKGEGVDYVPCFRGRRASRRAM